MKRSQNRQHGFTLIEAIVALVLIATAGMALFSWINSNIITLNRIQEINAGYPKKSGEVKEFYLNGYLKASGKVKDGELHGAWQWFRKDGTTMRSGSFKAGQKAGAWTTYSRDGKPYKVTRH